MSVLSSSLFARALGVSLIALSGTFGAGAWAATKPRKAAPAKVKPCACKPDGRFYTATPTPDVLALWAAARAGDEAAFLAVLPRVNKLADYAVDDRPILQALLWPSESDAVDEDEEAPDAATRRLAAHRARMPAITRMIAAAIAHGASVTDAADREPRPPLHLAMVFGTPDIVRMLLAAGAPVDQRDPREGNTALEFVLKPEHFIRKKSQVSRAERSAMLLQLFNAGAQRPFKNLEENSKKESIERPVADYLAWNPLLAMTEGADVVQALMKTGTRPVFDPEDGNDPTPLAVAASTGNAAAVQLLRTLLPKPAAGKEQMNFELDAAQAAAAGGHPELAKSLAAPGMPFDQIGPRGFNGEQLGLDYPQFSKATLLHFAVRSGDAAWVRQLVGMGALVDGVPPPPANEGEMGLPMPLGEALEGKRDDMVALLLELGANPLRGQTPILLQAMDKGDAATTELMLRHISPARHAQFAAMSTSIAHRWSMTPALNTPQHRPAIKALLEKAGYSPKHVNAAVLALVIEQGNDVLARELIAGGANVNCSACSGPDDTTSDSDAYVSTPLTAAVGERNPAMIDLLLARGAQVNRADGKGWLPMQLALLNGQEALLDRLLKAGAKLEGGNRDKGSALELAIASGQIALVDRVAAASGSSVASPCNAGAEALLASSDAYLDALVARGMQFNKPCAGTTSLLARMYGALIHNDRPLMGARRAAMTARFKRIDGTGGIGIELGEEGSSPMQLAIARKRADIVAMLLDGGAKADAASAWQAVQTRQPAVLHLLAAHGAVLADKTPAGPSLADYVRCRESDSFRAAAALPVSAGACPAQAPMTAQEQARVGKVAGHYYLKDVNEVGAELLLHPAGNFEFAMAYGASDTGAKGSWRVQGGSVVLLTPPGPAGLPFKLVAATRNPGQSGTALRFRHKGKPLTALQVFISGQDDDLAAYEPAADGFWTLPAKAKVDAIAVHLDGLRTGWNMIDLPANANRFDFELDASVIGDDAGFNETFDIVGQSLQWKRGDGRPMRFER